MALGFGLCQSVRAGHAADLNGLCGALPACIIRAVLGFTAHVQCAVGSGARVVLRAGNTCFLEIRAACLLAAAGGFSADQDVRAAAAFAAVVLAVTYRTVKICHRHTPLFLEYSDSLCGAGHFMRGYVKGSL